MLNDEIKKKIKGSKKSKEIKNIILNDEIKKKLKKRTQKLILYDKK
jgi:hypothetical protein